MWSREELLEWAFDGYADMLAQSKAVVRPFQYDLPPRVAYAGTYEWEDLAKGTFVCFAHKGRLSRSTFEWEIEHLEGATAPENSYGASSQLWEMAHLADINRHFRFIVGKAHHQPLRVYWDDKQLIGTSSKEMDLRDTRWWVEDGEPIAWLKGTGRDQSFEVFETEYTYGQAYDLKDASQGLPRYFTGSRTWTSDSGLDTWDYAYANGGDFHVRGLGRRITTQNSSYFYIFGWEDDLDTSTSTSAYTYPWEAPMLGLDVERLPTGTSRYVSSPDRQYLAAPYEGGGYIPVGIGRDWKSSQNAVTLWEVITTTGTVFEDDEPALVPRHLHKYLRWFVLAQAFGRKGEGQNADLAQHYSALYEVGVQFMFTMANQTTLDRNYAREDAMPVGRGRPPRPRLPSNYPAVRI